MKNRILLLLCLGVMALNNVFAQQLIGRQRVDQFPISQYGATTYGLTWLPTDYNSTTNKYPLIIFLHGSGEGGDGVSGLNNLNKTGLAQLIANGWNPEAVNPADGKNYKFIVVSPQAPSKSQWSYSYTHVKNILPDIIKRYRVDESRIYITGLSAGGGGSWSCVTNDGEFTKKIAAIAPISATGVNNPATEGKNIPLIGGTYGVKVWAICGMEDGHKSHNINDVNTINNATPKPEVPAAYTLLPGLGHVAGAWNTAYSAKWRDNPFKMNVFEWMLQYKRGNSPDPIPSNQSPVAKISTSEITLTLPSNTATLDGSSSTDADGSIKSYQWTKTAGPTQFSLGNATSAKASLSNLASGTYTFELTVTDDKNASSKAQIKIIVLDALNIAPIAIAGATQLITLPINLVTLNGSGSKDSDGSIASYSWRKISGPASFSLSTPLVSISLVTGLIQGSYSFELTVKDNRGAEAKDTTTIIVNPLLNRAPVAQASISASSIQLPVNSVELNGEKSTDPDNNIASYKWAKTEGPAAFTITNTAAAKTTVTGLTTGTYQFELTVTDNVGASSKAKVSVTVTPAPVAVKPPVAIAPNDTTLILPENSLRLRSGDSYDPAGGTLTSSWTKLSGPASFKNTNPGNAVTTIQDLVVGEYKVLLTVTNTSGAAGYDTITVAVKPLPNKAPVANATSSASSIQLPVNTVELNGSGSSDPDGNIASYRWAKTSGPASFALTTASAARTTVTALVEGTYQFELTVTDNAGASSTARVSITVAPAPVVVKSPIAMAGEDVTLILPTNSTVLRSKGSYNPDGGSVSSNWSKLSGPAAFSNTNPNNSITTITNLEAGVYQILLTVKNSKGAVGYDTVSITVKTATAPPPQQKNLIANAGGDQTISLPDNRVTLRSRNSVSLDGSSFKSRWSQLSGPTVAGNTNPNNSITSITKLTQGIYKIILTITDLKGNSDTDTVSITVKPGISTLSSGTISTMANVSELNKTILEEENMAGTIHIYPNPVSSSATLTLTGKAKGKSSLYVYSMAGKIVETKVFNKTGQIQQENLNLSGLPAGIYFVVVETEGGEKLRLRLVKL